MSEHPHHPHDHEVWGDDPEERHADAVVAELEILDPAAARRWHEHPAFVPFKAIGRFIRRRGKRIAVTIAGAVVVLVGIALLVLPGPGLVLIFAGLAILSTEYASARRLLEKAKEKAGQAKDAVFREKNGGAAPPDA